MATQPWEIFEFKTKEQWEKHQSDAIDALTELSSAINAASEMLVKYLPNGAKQQDICERMVEMLDDEIDVFKRQLFINGNPFDYDTKREIGL